VPTKAIQALAGGPGAPPTAFNDGTGAAVSSGAILGENHPPNPQYIARITVSATNQNSFRAHEGSRTPTECLLALLGPPGASQTAFNAWTGAALSSGAIFGEDQAVR
jgi:hypothetical protein